MAAGLSEEIAHCDNTCQYIIQAVTDMDTTCIVINNVSFSPGLSSVIMQHQRALSIWE